MGKNDEPAAKFGPHGGPMLAIDDGGSVELSVFETGVPPRGGCTSSRPSSTRSARFHDLDLDGLHSHFSMRARRKRP